MREEEIMRIIKLVSEIATGIAMFIFGNLKVRGVFYVIEIHKETRSCYGYEINFSSLRNNHLHEYSERVTMRAHHFLSEKILEDFDFSSKEVIKTPRFIFALYGFPKNLNKAMLLMVGFLAGEYSEFEAISFVHDKDERDQFIALKNCLFPWKKVIKEG